MFKIENPYLVVNLISIGKTQHNYRYNIHFCADMKSKFLVCAGKEYYRLNKLMKIKELFD